MHATPSVRDYSVIPTSDRPNFAMTFLRTCRKLSDKLACTLPSEDFPTKRFDRPHSCH